MIVNTVGIHNKLNAKQLWILYFYISEKEVIKNTSFYSLIYVYHYHHITDISELAQMGEAEQGTHYGWRKVYDCAVLPLSDKTIDIKPYTSTMKKLKIIHTIIPMHSIFIRNGSCFDRKKKKYGIQRSIWWTKVLVFCVTNNNLIAFGSLSN